MGSCFMIVKTSFKDTNYRGVKKLFVRFPTQNVLLSAPTQPKHLVEYRFWTFMVIHPTIS